jgi:hypothetical protein
MVFVVFGGFVIAALIGAPEARAQAPVTIDGARFAPLSGWEVARTIRGATPAVQLSKGAGNLLVVVFPGEADPATMLDRYVAEVLQPEAIRLQLSEEVEQEPLGSGITALRRFYAGSFQNNPAPLEGDLTAFAIPSGPGVVFDGWAQQGAYQQFAGEVRTMAGTAEVG